MIMDNFDSPFLYNRPSLDVEGVKKAIVYKLIFLIGRSPKEASQRDWLNATLHAVRDLVTEGWITTARQSRAEETRRVYYLSMEFLIGRTLSNAMIAEGVYDVAEKALAELNVNFEEIIEKEVDPGLGNGGLGRLAACFMDSLATLAIPAMGYGIRYEYGMFRQKLKMVNRLNVQMIGWKKVHLGNLCVHQNVSVLILVVISILKIKNVSGIRLKK